MARLSPDVPKMIDKWSKEYNKVFEEIKGKTYSPEQKKDIINRLVTDLGERFRADHEGASGDAKSAMQKIQKTAHDRLTNEIFGFSFDPEKIDKETLKKFSPTDVVQVIEAEGLTPDAARYSSDLKKEFNIAGLEYDPARVGEYITKGYTPEDISYVLQREERERREEEREEEIGVGRPKNIEDIQALFTEKLKEVGYTDEEIGSVIESYGRDIEEMADAIGEGTLRFSEIRAGLPNILPEYQERREERERVELKEEARVTREELGEELEKRTEERLGREVPRFEQAFKRLGGRERASAAVAAERMKGELEQERERTLAGAGIEAAARQEGYRREDYIRNIVNQYNQSLRDWQGFMQREAEQRGFEMQKYWYPIEQQNIRAQQLSQERVGRETRDWQTAMTNLQRQWAKEDRDYLAKLQKQQMWSGILGQGLGIAAGVGISKWLG